MLQNYAVPAFGTRKAEAVTPSEVAALHLSLRSKGTTANRVHDVISSIYGWAIKSKVLPKMDNPATGIEKFRENKHERYPSVEGMQRLGAAIREAETVGIPWERD
jgi:hypothetical protein